MKKLTAIAVVAVILSLTATTASIFALIDDRGSHSLNLDATMSSVLEITCYEDGDPKIRGTGFVIGDDNRYVLTNAHLIVASTSENDYYENIIGKNANSAKEYPLSVVTHDSDKDLALLRFEGECDLRSLTIDKERPSYGERVIVIGNARGYGLSVKEALVSIPEINITNDGVLMNCIMISLSLDQGDSGSPIINAHGEVIGISSFRMKDEGKVIDNMSFGITSRSIGDFIRPFL